MPDSLSQRGTFSHHLATGNGHKLTAPEQSPPTGYLFPLTLSAKLTNTAAISCDFYLSLTEFCSHSRGDRGAVCRHGGGGGSASWAVKPSPLLFNTPSFRHNTPHPNRPTRRRLSQPHSQHSLHGDHLVTLRYVSCFCTFDFAVFIHEVLCNQFTAGSSVGDVLVEPT